MSLTCFRLGTRLKTASDYTATADTLTTAQFYLHFNSISSTKQAGELCAVALEVVLLQRNLLKRVDENAEIAISILLS